MTGARRWIVRCKAPIRRNAPYFLPSQACLRFLGRGHALLMIRFASLGLAASGFTIGLLVRAGIDGAFVFLGAGVGGLGGWRRGAAKTIIKPAVKVSIENDIVRFIPESFQRSIPNVQHNHRVRSRADFGCRPDRDQIPTSNSLRQLIRPCTGNGFARYFTSCRVRKRCTSGSVQKPVMKMK